MHLGYSYLHRAHHPTRKRQKNKKHTDKPRPCNISPTSLKTLFSPFSQNMSSFLHKIDFFHTSHPSRPCAGRYRPMPGMRNPFNEAPAKPNNNIDSKNEREGQTWQRRNKPQSFHPPTNPSIIAHPSRYENQTQTQMKDEKTKRE
ncbi:hypothetical protein VTJ04DRAFT_5734 [Mycothermus thermophilus]|uniref:uncharacterized protein n=1 Tax=Humicola insolens TaxID=85995 RepID=UPI003743D0AC